MATEKESLNHRLVRFLGADLETYEDEPIPAINNTDLYVEEEPTILDWFKEIAPTPRSIGRYVWSLFPFLHWIGNYNLTWFTGDLIAGKQIHDDHI